MTSAISRHNPVQTWRHPFLLWAMLNSCLHFTYMRWLQQKNNKRRNISFIYKWFPQKQNSRDNTKHCARMVHDLCKYFSYKKLQHHGTSQNPLYKKHIGTHTLNTLKNSASDYTQAYKVQWTDGRVRHNSCGNCLINIFFLWNNKKSTLLNKKKSPTTFYFSK